jgi:hypothetical protein
MGSDMLLELGVDGADGAESLMIDERSKPTSHA